MFTKRVLFTRVGRFSLIALGGLVWLRREADAWTSALM